MRGLVLPWVALMACSAQSSGEHCPTAGTVQVDITDNVTDNPICNASVSATPMGGGNAQSFAPQGGGTSCHYVGLLQAGQYAVTASDSGYTTYSTVLTIRTDGCAIDSPTLAFQLSPTQ